MVKSIGSIVDITATQNVTTSIDDYFKNVMIVAAFSETTDLKTGVTGVFTNGYEEYASLTAVGEHFPEAHNVYTWAADVFAQTGNSGVNDSKIKKLVVVQKKSTDTTYKAALEKVNYRNAYWVVPITDTVADVRSVYSWIEDNALVKLLFSQDDSLDIKDSGVDTDIASVLKTAAAARAATWYYGDQSVGLAPAMAAILISNNPGDRASFFKTPSSITVSTLTSSEAEALDTKRVNYFDILVGNAGTISDNNLTFNGLLANGDAIQKTYQNDRIRLTLEARAIDVLKRDIPYDNRGAAQLEGELTNVLRAFKAQELIKDQTFTDSKGNVVNGYNIRVYPVADTAVDYPTQYNAQQFIVEAEYLLALTAKGVEVNITFSV